MAAPPLDLAATVAALETRVAALEANLSHVEEDTPDPTEVDRLRWFMKHGRRRPW